MRNISHKPESLRTATARSSVAMPAYWVEQVKARNLEKGDALEIARVAAIQAAKRTADLIPFCHQVPLTHVRVGYTFADNSIGIEVGATAVAATGVEMEALTGAALAALTLYDMVKPHTKEIAIGPVLLDEKQGGKDSEAWHERPITLALDGADAARAATWFGDLAAVTLRAADADLRFHLHAPGNAPLLQAATTDSGLEQAMRDFAVRRLPAAAVWSIRAATADGATIVAVEDHGPLTDQLLAAIAPALVRRIRGAAS